MTEIRLHGRAGQGALTAGQLLAEAAFADGRYAFVFPYFGNDRGGVPIMSFVRIDDRPVSARTPVANPDFVIVLDPTLIALKEVVSGIKSEGMFLLNFPLSPLEVQPCLPARVVVIPAYHISTEVLGKVEWSNTVLLGAFAAASGVVGLEALQKAVARHFTGDQARKNLLALERGYQYIITTCHIKQA